MKKLIFVLIVAFFIYGCDSDENGTKKTDSTQTETVVIDNGLNAGTDTTEVSFTEEEVNTKSDEILNKSEDVLNELDELLKTL
jgi:uncharacterized protein YcfL